MLAKRSEMEAALNWPENERALWFGRILETSANEIYIFRADDLRFIEVNEGARRNLGFTREEMLAFTVLDVKPNLTQDEFNALTEPLRSGEKDLLVFESQHRRKSGSLYPVEVRLQLFKSEQFAIFVAIITDATERVAAESRLKNLFEAFPDAILIMDEQGCVQCNEAALRMFRVDSRVALSELWREMLAAAPAVPGVGIDRAIHQLRQAMGMAEFSGEVLLRRADGEVFPVWVILSPYVENDRGFSQLILRDITEQRRTECALRESEERFALAMAGADDGLWDWNLKTDAVYFSPRWKNMLGYEENELANHVNTWSDSVHPDDLDRALTKIDDYWSGRIGEYAIEFRMKHKAGHYVDILSRGIIVRDESGAPSRFVGTHVDISERKRSEELLQQRYRELATANQTIKSTQAQLLQAEKMASIGELAAGIAHEINNPVGFVSSNIKTLKEYSENLLGLIELYTRFEASPADRLLLKDIQAFKKQIDLDFIKDDVHALGAESEEGIARVVRIIKDLKTFSHMDQGDCQLSDLHVGLDSTLNIAHNGIKYKAEVVKDYGELPLVRCNASQINQVFMNLIVNAAHAIEKQGRITIHTEKRDADWVCVEISDTGCGVPEAIKRRIFEPFFTTKEVGKGTGLGLAISYRIIESHGGRIEVDSVEGQGSTFRVWLPLTRE